MQKYFYELVDFLTGKLSAGEVFTARFSGEDSDFTRFNQSKVRQAGHVSQRYFGVDLIDGQRHASGNVTLTGEREEDERLAVEMLDGLRAKLPGLPEDPYLLYATEVNSTEQHGENQLIDAGDMVNRVLEAGEGRDLVGILASGGIYSGFANSLGQRNWFSTYSFNLDWSFYYRTDKAVKVGYGGFEWNQADFEKKVKDATVQLSILEREPKTIDPGNYRVYLAPVALYDFVGMIGWGGYGLRNHKTKQTVLLKMIEEGTTLDSSVTISENTADGVAENFQGEGFLKPDRVTLIENGALGDCLVSPRSAKEYGVETNGAPEWESPESLDIAPGTLDGGQILGKLDTGVFINNVWYLNFSDRSGCRITGLTRFACFWVENGEIVAPLNVMRFDETMYRALGENLIGLTKDREMILDAGTYGGRGTSSGRIPGALIEDFHFNL